MPRPAREYRCIDAAIVSIVQATEPTSYRTLLNHLERRAREFGAELRDRPVFRVLDRRLRVLRQSGQLVPDRETGWRCREHASQAATPMSSPSHENSPLV